MTRDQDLPEDRGDRIDRWLRRSRRPWRRREVNRPRPARIGTVRTEYVRDAAGRLRARVARTPRRRARGAAAMVWDTLIATYRDVRGSPEAYR